MSEIDIYKGIAKKQVKQAVLDMYKLAGDNNLYYYEQIQEIIDYIAELEMKIHKAIKYIDIYIKTANCLNTDYDINMMVVKDILNGEDNE